MDYRKELLSKSTLAEKSVCKALDIIGIRYIRQYPIRTAQKTFYADIYIPTLRLIIEVDGQYHYTQKQKRLDANRSACIRKLGLHIYRISNTKAYNAKNVFSLLKRYKSREKRTLY